MCEKVENLTVFNRTCHLQMGRAVSLIFSPGISIFVETEKFKHKGFYMKSFEFAEKHNTDENYYIRYFVYCDKDETDTEEICFVTDK